MLEGLIKRVKKIFTDNTIYVSKNGQQVYTYTPSGDIIGGKLEFGGRTIEEVKEEYGIDSGTRVKNVDYGDMPSGMKRAFIALNEKRAAANKEVIRRGGRPAAGEINFKNLLALRHLELNAYVTNLDMERSQAVKKSKQKADEGETGEKKR